MSSEIGYKKFLLSKYIDRIAYEEGCVMYLNAEYKKQILTNFINRSELTEPSEENVKDWLGIHLGELISLNEEGRVFNLSQVAVILTNVKIEGQCHASSALNWVLNQNLEIYSGFTDKLHYHSWLYDPVTKIIYEPTPYLRSRYFGFRHSKSLDFVVDELNSIYCLYKDNKIDERSFIEFKQKLDSLINT